MEFFYEPLYENKEFSKAHEVLKENKSVYVPGTTDSQRIHLSHAFGASFDVRFIITYDDIRAGEIYEESKMYDKDVVYLKARISASIRPISAAIRLHRSAFAL